jgi:hypothetical protein
MATFATCPIQADVYANALVQHDSETKQGPSNDDWERLRPDIERLYIDENRTLEDVMRIMTDEYGHKGT